MPIRVLLADDSEVVRKAISRLLQSDPEIGLVAEAISYGETEQLTRRLRPQVVVMDIHMPIIDGFQAAHEIMATYPVPVVIMSGMSDARTASRAVDLDIISYLVKPFSPAQLKIAVHLAVAQFRGLVSNEIVSAA